RSLAEFAGDLVAGGTFGPQDGSAPRDFARWDGTHWGALGADAPQFGNVRRLRTVGASLYALGNFGGLLGHAIARWDGTSWHADEEQLQLFAFDLTTFEGALCAGGALARDGDAAATPLVQKRAAAWQPLLPGAGMRGFLGWSGPVIFSLLSTPAG